MGWKSSGLSYNVNGANAQQYLKMNAYAVQNAGAIGGAAGVMGSDPRSGHAFVKVYTQTKELLVHMLNDLGRSKFNYQSRGYCS
jgi:hypothetical protein